MNSVTANIAGKNALGKVQRDQNITASLDLLSVLASTIKSQEYAK